MDREFNTNVKGQEFSDERVELVWKKAMQTFSLNVAYDKYKSEIHFFDYGNTDSEYGWEIDHIKPVAKGGTDGIDNLQPLQWETNRSKEDSTAVNYCPKPK